MTPELSPMEIIEVWNQMEEWMDRLEKHCREVSEHWGDDLLPIMACEEAAEVIQSLSKIRRSGSAAQYEAAKENLIEELGDLAIILFCLLDLYSIDVEDIFDRINYKMEQKYE